MVCFSFGLIFGRSGSGKTILLQLLAGLNKPTSGSILVQKYGEDGHPDQLPPGKVGIVFQFPEREIPKGNKKPYMPPKEVHVQKTHTMPPQKIEIFKSLDKWAEQNLLTLLKPVEKCWQPQDFLLDPSSDGFEEQVKELRERTKEIPDDYFVVLVGDMITEEALPTYQTMINTLEGVRDETGASLTPWAIWTRA